MTQFAPEKREPTRRRGDQKWGNERDRSGQAAVCALGGAEADARPVSSDQAENYFPIDGATGKCAAGAGFIGLEQNG